MSGGRIGRKESTGGTAVRRGYLQRSPLNILMHFGKAAHLNARSYQL